MGTQNLIAFDLTLSIKDTSGSKSHPLLGNPRQEALSIFLLRVRSFRPVFLEMVSASYQLNPLQTQLRMCTNSEAWKMEHTDWLSSGHMLHWNPTCPLRESWAVGSNDVENL